MLDHLKAQQAALGRKDKHRLMALVGLALVTAVAMVGTRSCGSRSVPPDPGSALVPPAPTDGGPEPVVLDRARFLAVGDGEAAQQDARYERGVLDYVLPLSGGAIADIPRHVTAEALAALPFEEAAARAYEVRGRVVKSLSEEFRTATQRLWTLVVEGAGGARFLVLKKGLASDPQEGRPRSAARDDAWIQEGDPVVVRGIYLQRRVGSVGDTLLAEPTPVLVLLKMRRAEEPRPPIESPAKADWNEVEDRFMAETKRWEEPALFQTLQWAAARGPARLRADIRSGALPHKVWNRDTFMAWEKEIEVTSDNQPRPFTDAARGQLWAVTGIVGQFVYEGWETISDNPQGVDHLYVFDLLADDYSVLGRSIALRNFSIFPPDAYEGITGKREQPVRMYGYFLKNYTYVSKYKSVRQEGAADVTVPAFVVIDLEPIVTVTDNTSIWIVVGSMVLFAALFFGILGTAERRERKRMEVHRLELRQRARAAGQGIIAEPYRGAPAPKSSADDVGKPPPPRAP